MSIRIGSAIIFKQKGGVISREDCWVCFNHEYMYIKDTLLQLLWQMATEWNNDKHIVG